MDEVEKYETNIEHPTDVLEQSLDDKFHGLDLLRFGNVHKGMLPFFLNLARKRKVFVIKLLINFSL